ncbi:MAG: DUF2796 domain-containing protein [Betaproteobacteria bacterium]|nr:DUF2796 domain-containing protein [Betaproteobacteria bacterium]
MRFGLSQPYAWIYRVTLWALVLFLGFHSLPLIAHAKPHEHGVAALEISLSGQTLNLRLSSPLDSFLGWERAPRNDQEKALYRQLRQDLSHYAPILSLPVQAGCVLEKAEVSDPHRLSGGQSTSEASAEHQDLVAEWWVRCEMPNQLKRVTIQGFDRFKRLRRVDVVANTASGLGKARLTSRQRDFQMP